MARKPIINPPLSVWKRLRYAVQLWAFKGIVALALSLMRTLKAAEIKKNGPNFTKRYPVRPMLENRVFIPRGHQAGTKIPLYFNIHGGGFAITDPQMDDPFCRNLADQNGFCVVSLNYRKAPTYPFPVAVHDVGEIAKAVLADPDLPIDLSNVMGGGFSAGGNLILAMSQLDGVRGKLKAIIPVYPVVDFSNTFKGKYRTTKAGKRDMLETSSAFFNWGYINFGQDRSDPLLSVIYAAREALPKQIMFVGAQYDYLCHEAHVMAKQLAGVENDTSFQEGHSWNKDGIRWYFVEDVQHGYTHARGTGLTEEHRQKMIKETYDDMAKWLKDEVVS